MQLLDGNNFNNILYQNSYTTYGEIHSSGKGVRFNRQMTLVDTAHNPLSGLYLEDASFDQSYLYNNYTYSKFKNSNTQYNRRGKFGCSWKPDSAVSILDNSHWSFERISMNMN